MKFVALILTVFTSVSAFAGLSLPEQEALLNKIAKEIRRELYINGYSNVSSQVAGLDASEFAKYIANNQARAEQKLDDQEIAQINACFKAANCEVYVIAVSSEFQAGTGMENNWILLNTDSAKYEKINQLVYSE